MQLANLVLAKHLVRHNRQFTVTALDPEPAWRERPQQLDQLFCFKFHRVVALDHTVRFAAQVIDIPRPGPRSLARSRAEVQQRFDGSLRVLYQGRCLATAATSHTGWATSRPPSCHSLRHDPTARSSHSAPLPGSRHRTTPGRRPGSRPDDKIPELLRGQNP
jgi:hypothetical protein